MGRWRPLSLRPVFCAGNPVTPTRSSRTSPLPARVGGRYPRFSGRDFSPALLSQRQCVSLRPGEGAGLGWVVLTVSAGGGMPIAPRSSERRLASLGRGRLSMPLEDCSDESLACSVGLQGTPSRVMRATVEGREILSAANGSGGVEDDGDTGVFTAWAASASDVCAGSASRLAHGDGRLQRRGRPLSFSGCARAPALGRGASFTWSPASSAAGGTAGVPIVVARVGAGIANT
jgi:hypothetical protein